MMGWCTSHPWLTFWIAMFAIAAMDNVIANITKAIIARKKAVKASEI